MQIVNGQPNDPPTDVLIPWLVLYSLVYALAGFACTYLVFRRKEV
jgi:hypothetical protein